MGRRISRRADALTVVVCAENRHDAVHDAALGAQLLRLQLGGDARESPETRQLQREGVVPGAVVTFVELAGATRQGRSFTIVTYPHTFIL